MRCWTRIFTSKIQGTLHWPKDQIDGLKWPKNACLAKFSMTLKPLLQNPCISLYSCGISNHNLNSMGRREVWNVVLFPSVVTDTTQGTTQFIHQYIPILIESFYGHKFIGTTQIDQALNTQMQQLPFVKLELGLDQRVAPYGISMLLDHFHQN